MKKAVSLLPLLVIIFITLVFFYKVFLGFVPMPLDILVGGYFPWLDYKWGYIVGVPVKNPILSDAFSQLIPWRSLALDSFHSFEWPIWNPYSFSGTPLLANWQSGALYPLNILLLMFGKVYGWTLLVIFQIFFSMVFMYLYIKNLGLQKYTAIFGSITFAFSGLMMTHLEFGNIGQSFMWLPLALYLIDRYLITNNLNWLILLPVVNFFIFTAGHFQGSLFPFIAQTIYFLVKAYLKKLSLKSLIIPLFILLLCLTISSVQLVPTGELLINSFRQSDQNAASQNFGLVPIQHLVTFFIPDFFGNHSTMNYWGVNNYHETQGYVGVITIVFLGFALLNIKKLKDKTGFIFLFFFILSAILVIDNPLGRLIYIFKLPLLSTGYASRGLIFLDFSLVILACFGFEAWVKGKVSPIKINIYILAALIGVLLGLLISLKILGTVSTGSFAKDYQNFNVALRNSLIPTGILLGLLVLLFLYKFSKKSVVLIIILVVLDMFRFGWKYESFSKSSLYFPKTPVINFLQENVGYYRIDREQSEVFPPNTWMMYGLQSPSGYDPLYWGQYAKFYNIYNGGSPNSGVSRYAELSNYNSKFIDLAGVKYLVVAKRKDGIIDKNTNQISYKISDPKYKRVFEDQSVIVLENTRVIPRAIVYKDYLVEPDNQKSLEKLHQDLDFRKKVILDQEPIFTNFKDSSNSLVKILNYKNTSVTLEVESSSDNVLMLTDANYPGWKVEVDQKPAQILMADGVYRAVSLPAGNHLVVFSYFPRSFRLGLIVSGGSFLLLGIIFLYSKYKKE
jgi:hypothetical protein